MPKIRESGMPEEDVWTSFFAPAKILRILGLSKGVFDVADFGCGYGTFTLPVANMVKGKIYAFDIEPQMIKIVDQKAKKLNKDIVVPILRDFVSEGSGLGDLSVDFVMLFNILHFENPIGLLKEAYRILRCGGKVGIIH
jgi:ubiquinone/menaquinone biosynthesis C-methylase UbiE